jgi:anti-anti-sigma regulatory factor
MKTESGTAESTDSLCAHTLLSPKRLPGAPRILSRFSDTPRSAKSSPSPDSPRRRLLLPIWTPPFRTTAFHTSHLEVLLNAFSIEFQRAREQNRQLEAERLSLIAKLQSALAALAAPIIDIWEGIVVLPLIGPIDDERAQEITSRLLDRLQRHQIATVIVDLTGVTEASDPLARHLSRLFSAVRLLGVRCAISGISPAVAREMVRLGVDWPSDIHRSLAEALHATVEIQPSRQQVAARMRRSAYE